LTQSRQLLSQQSRLARVEANESLPRARVSGVMKLIYKINFDKTLGLYIYQ
jgi:hypothetical protein